MNDPRDDYPLAEKHPDLVTTHSGVPLADITLERVLAGEVGNDDLRITADSLRKQADIAAASGQSALAANLRRAAELTAIPNGTLLEVYNAMRPHRSTKQELEMLCNTLENTYGAEETAGFIRSAIPVYESKQLFKQKA